MTARARFRRRTGVNPPDAPRTHRRTAYARLMAAAHVAHVNAHDRTRHTTGPIRNANQLTAAGLPQRWR